MTTQNDNVNVDAPATITIPNMLHVSVRDTIQGDVDLTKLGISTIQHLISDRILMMSRNKSAGMKGETAADKLKAEQGKFDEFLDGSWKPGKRGTKPVSVAARAEEQLLMRLFGKVNKSQSETVLRKLARQDGAWDAYLLTAISQSENREDVTAEEVKTYREAHQASLDTAIAAEVEAVEAEDERIRLAKESGEADVANLFT